MTGGEVAQAELRGVIGGEAREHAMGWSETVGPRGPMEEPARVLAGGEAGLRVLEIAVAELERLARSPCPRAPPAQVAETGGLPPASPSWSAAVLRAGEAASRAEPLPTALRAPGVPQAASLEEASLMALALSAERCRRADALLVRGTRGGPRVSGPRRAVADALGRGWRRRRRRRACWSPSAGPSWRRRGRRGRRPG